MTASPGAGAVGLELQAAAVSARKSATTIERVVFICLIPC